MKINSLLLISLILFSRVSTQNTNSINASLNTAKFLEKKGDIDGAISIYQGILEKTRNTLSLFTRLNLFISATRDIMKAFSSSIIYSKMILLI